MPKVVGQIDLEAINKAISKPKQKSFWISKIVANFGNQRQVNINLGHDYNDAKTTFSLIIGKNGIGKSSLLHEIIEFFIDVRTNSVRKKDNWINIVSVEYHINNYTYRIDKSYFSKVEYYRNGKIIDATSMKYPLIIASTMGMFDKFPINNILGNTRQKRYNIPFYRYVGPKANYNIFMSKTNMLMQLMAYAGNGLQDKQVKQIKNIMQFIGYDPHITLTYKISNNLDSDNIRQKNLNISISKLGIKEQQNIDLFYDERNVDNKYNFIKTIYEAKQTNIIQSIKCILYHNGEAIDCDMLSSGEFNMLCIVLSIILSYNNDNILVLLDEPEISQHPNWQVDIISKLEEALNEHSCHFIIATHCHYLVSNLPIDRSNVINLYKDDNNIVNAEYLECNTYGWSAEEVLLKTFHMATDRSNYLAELIAKFLTDIANNDISHEKSKEQLAFLNTVSQHLSNVDPMKKLINSITKEFYRND